MEACIEAVGQEYTHFSIFFLFLLMAVGGKPPRFIRMLFNSPRIYISYEDSESELLQRFLSFDDFPTGWHYADVNQIENNYTGNQILNNVTDVAYQILSGKYKSIDFQIYQKINRFDETIIVSEYRDEYISNNFSNDDQSKNFIIWEKEYQDQIQVYCKYKQFDIHDNFKTNCSIYKMDDELFEEIYLSGNGKIQNSELEAIIDDIVTVRFYLPKKSDNCIPIVEGIIDHCE